MVCIGTRSHSELKPKPAVWQLILGRELIAPGSSADLHKNPAPVLWLSCLFWRPDQKDVDRAWIVQGAIDASGKGDYPASSQCPPPPAALSAHQRHRPSPLPTPPGLNTPPSPACATACSWSTTAGLCWSSQTAPAAGRCI